MMNIKLLNKISKVGIDALDPALYNVGTDIEDPDAIMVRSAVMHDMTFGKNLLAIARCGAGVNNIPVERCTKEGIVVFNTPGANANGVKELTICALMLASRKIVDGIEWVKTLKGTTGVAKAVEAGKSKFAGCEVSGKTLGVIGLGAIGGMVANTATHLGMNVIGYDPYLTVEGAWGLSRNVKKAKSYDEIFKEADYITLHVPATAETKNMINAKTISEMKDGVRIINLARADLVNDKDIIEALAAGKVASYVTDFPTDELVGVDGVIAIPHLGASTEESEDNCAVMAAAELDDYLRFGNITNSVNFPNVSMPHSGETRICVFHANVPTLISQITTALSEHHINIENMINKSKGDNAYTMVDVSAKVPESVIEKIKAIPQVTRVRVI
ncbi:MAG: phosphoglycerate dehydrogenase [Clostridiales bacterium]|nr:phosphoglycerate dehydrogenase [Clostridiales bacterium]